MAVKQLHKEKLTGYHNVLSERCWVPQRTGKKKRNVRVKGIIFRTDRTIHWQIPVQYYARSEYWFRAVPVLGEGELGRDVLNSV